MKIHVQYGNNLMRIEVSKSILIGDLYQIIIDKLGICFKQIIDMYFNNKSLGYDHLNFDRKLNHSGLYNNCIIYVIFNHFPNLTRLHGQPNHHIYEQWQYKANNHYISQGLLFDPIFNTNNLNDGRQREVDEFFTQTYLNSYIDSSQQNHGPSRNYRNDVQPINQEHERQPTTIQEHAGQIHRNLVAENSHLNQNQTIDRSQQIPQNNHRSQQMNQNNHRSHSMNQNQNINRSQQINQNNDRSQEVDQNPNQNQRQRFTSRNNHEQHRLMRQTDHNSSIIGSQTLPSQTNTNSNSNRSQPNQIRQQIFHSSNPNQIFQRNENEQFPNMSNVLQITTQLLRNFGTFLDIEPVQDNINNGFPENIFQDFYMQITSGDINNFMDLENVPVTLTEQQIDLLHVKKYKDIVESYKLSHLDENPYDRCPITKELFEDNTDVIILDCGHYFAIEGIQTWLVDHSTKCPCCNSDVRDFIAQIPQNSDQLNRNRNITNEDSIDSESTDEESTDEESTDEENTDEENTELESSDLESTDEEITDEEITDEETTEETTEEGDLGSVEENNLNPNINENKNVCQTFSQSNINRSNSLSATTNMDAFNDNMKSLFDLVFP